MSPRTPKQFKEIREEKKALILQAALEVFAEEGYFQASISKIAKKAQISKGLLYNYFEGKEHLLKVIIMAGFSEMLGPFDKNNDGVLTEEKFRNYIYEIFDLTRKNYNYWKLYFAVLMQPSVLKLIEEEFRQTVEPFFTMLIEYYIQKGEKNPLAKSRLMGAVMDGVGIHFLMDPENFPLKDVQEMIIEMFV